MTELADSDLPGHDHHAGGLGRADEACSRSEFPRVSMVVYWRKGDQI